MNTHNKTIQTLILGLCPARDWSWLFWFIAGVLVGFGVWGLILL